MGFFRANYTTSDLAPGAAAARLALSLLLAALTISLALLVPVATAGSLLQLPVTIGFAMTISLTLWLFISILRGTR